MAVNMKHNNKMMMMFMMMMMRDVGSGIRYLE